MVATGRKPAARRADLSRRAVPASVFQQSGAKPRRALGSVQHNRPVRVARTAVGGVLAGAVLFGGMSFAEPDLAAAKPIGYNSNWPKLHKGDKGKAVVRLQRELSAYGPNVSDTGYYGKRTKKLVKRLERRNGLKVNGVASGSVWHVLLTDGNRVTSPKMVGGGGGNGGGDSAKKNTVWDKLAKCESGGNWSINTGNGYYGGLQFSLQTWRGYGGSGMPHRTSRTEQIRIAEKVQNGQGWGAWPSCSSKLGLR
jgi:peptidoglycan hydrolase-like protein with peptidoglycan-binding domain